MRVNRGLAAHSGRFFQKPERPQISVKKKMASSFLWGSAETIACAKS